MKELKHWYGDVLINKHNVTSIGRIGMTAMLVLRKLLASYFRCPVELLQVDYVVHSSRHKQFDEANKTTTVQVFLEVVFTGTRVKVRPGFEGQPLAICELLFRTWEGESEMKLAFFDINSRNIIFRRDIPSWGYKIRPEKPIPISTIKSFRN